MCPASSLWRGGKKPLVTRTAVINKGFSSSLPPRTGECLFSYQTFMTFGDVTWDNQVVY